MRDERFRDDPERQEARGASTMDPAAAAQLAAEAALSRKALDVRVLDLRGIASFTDYFVICSGTSDTHIEGVTSAIIETMEEANQRLWHREGDRRADWILLDYVDVVVHIFTKTAREFYELERLWSEAVPVPVDEAGVAVDPAWVDVDLEAEGEFVEFTAEDDDWDDDWDEE
jgi:ribosome-associated protein